MMKNFLWWIGLTIFFSLALYGITSFISPTSLTRPLSEFEMLLNLIGISSILSFNVVASRVILNEIRKK